MRKFFYIFVDNKNALVSTIDYIISSVPVVESLFAATIMLLLFRTTKEKHHFQLSIVFVFLFTFYLMSVLFYSGIKEIIAVMFVLSLPVTLSILPSFYLYLISVNNNLKPFQKQIHYAPAVVIFWLMMLFWLEPVSVQYNFVAGNIGDLSDFPLLKFVQGVYKTGVYVIINAQLIAYMVLILLELRSYRHQIADQYSLKKQMNLSALTYIILFFFLLYILIILSHFLGVSKDPVSCSIFNLVSSGIIVFLLIRGFKHRSVAVLDDFDQQFSNENESANP